MKKQHDTAELLAAWNKIPRRLRSALRGLDERDLELTGGPEAWTIRETVHHIVEANLVAANMIVAALANNGGDFDWTWVNPSKSWMRRVGYDTVDVAPAIAALRALCRHISALVAERPGAMTRTVKLNDTPGAKRYALSVQQILGQEVEHADHHLADIRQARGRRARQHP